MKVRQEIPVECRDPEDPRIPSLDSYRNTCQTPARCQTLCQALKLWKLERSPRLVQLTFERAKASDHDNVVKTGKGYGGCEWFFSELLVPFRDRGPGLAAELSPE